jgi:hypothetical protein
VCEGPAGVKANVGDQAWEEHGPHDGRAGMDGAHGDSGWMEVG